MRHNYLVVSRCGTTISLCRDATQLSTFCFFFLRRVFFSTVTVSPNPTRLIAVVAARRPPFWHPFFTRRLVDSMASTSPARGRRHAPVLRGAPINLAEQDRQRELLLLLRILIDEGNGAIRRLCEEVHAFLSSDEGV
jgi:hypothetical protein